MKILLLIFKVFYNNARVTTIDKLSLRSLTCVALLIKYYFVFVDHYSRITRYSRTSLCTPLPPLEYWSYKLRAWHRGTEEGFGGICCA
jgi:hypothetical protein